MKRFLVVLGVLLCLSVPAPAVVIEAWMVGYTNESAMILQDMIDELFTPSSGIMVDIVPIAWGDYYQRYLLAAASGDSPDIFTLGSETVDFGLRGALLDLRGRFGQEYEEVASWVFPATLRPFQFQGTGFGIPFRISSLIAAYRTDILDEMGATIPVTWTDAYPLQTRLRAQGRTLGMEIGNLNSPLWGAYTHITQHGGNFFGEDGFTSALDRPESIAGFKEFINLFSVHDFPRSGPGYTAFLQGEWVMNVDGSWLYPNLAQGAPQLAGKWALSLVPGTRRPSGEISHSTFVGGSTLAISKDSTKAREAWEFIKWFVSAPIQTQLTDTVLGRIQGMLDLPANMEAMNQINLPTEVKKAFHDQIIGSIPVPYAVNINVLYRHVDFAVNEAALLGHDPEAAARKAANAMNSEMSRRRQEYERFLSRL